MDNYKILNTKTNAIIKLLNELGYAWVPTTNDCEASLLKAHWILAESSGDICYSSTDSFYEQDSYKELSFNQLNDLVVLKRNDMKDANNTNLDNGLYFLSSDNVIYRWEGKWVRSILNDSEDYNLIIQHGLNPIEKPQDPALISGADALRALADGKDVEGFSEENEEWIPIVYFTVQEVVNGLYKFRLKPQTIKLELEIPAPYKAKIGGRDDASFVLNVGRHQYCYNNEEDYTKARDALESVFDAAVRGTNS
ncbi:hypothetical protein [Acinetobacter nosocomialis]|uniref:hypothetical protein n=1 Tax=Acinetobacter nosocomialis TaxID=106654 RepID=UPI00126A5F53|nr:hypothetical protein [Acinetobacter nosocomialis]